jgi:hypothetical protein
MTGKHAARGLLLAVGMLLAGCGGTEVAEAPAPSLETREDRFVCNEVGTYHIWNYYADAAMTVVVGQRICDCDGPSSWGRSTAFSYEVTGDCP